MISEVEKKELDPSFLKAIDEATSNSIEVTKLLYFKCIDKNKDSLNKLMIYLNDLFFHDIFLETALKEFDKMRNEYSDFLKGQEEVLKKNILTIFSLFKNGLSNLKDKIEESYFRTDYHLDQYMLVISYHLKQETCDISEEMFKNYGFRAFKILGLTDRAFAKKNKYLLAFKKARLKGDKLLYKKFISKINKMEEVVNKFINSFISDLWSNFNYIFNSNKEYGLPFLIRKHLKNKNNRKRIK